MKPINCPVTVIFDQNVSFYSCLNVHTLVNSRMDKKGFLLPYISSLYTQPGQMTAQSGPGSPGGFLC